MNVLDLAQEIGLQPKKASLTNGGEYKSSCPKCQAGKDRFCIWPNRDVNGRYWCRQCNCRGDAIQFCRDFLGLSYGEACHKLQMTPRHNSAPKKGYCPFRKKKFIPSIAQPTSEVWKMKAAQFIADAHKQLLATHDALQLVYRRGFTLETIKQFQLGWNPEDIFDSRLDWGLPSEINDKGKERKQWLPKGIVIPGFVTGEPVQLKIRRTGWTLDDDLPKYVEVSGGSQRPFVFGDLTKPVIIMESELDGILVQQFAQDLCCCLALGGVVKRPDLAIHELLSRAPLILLSLDFDEAGKKHHSFWMSIYPNLKPWPASVGKSPGDSYLLGIDLFSWVKAGLSPC